MPIRVALHHRTSYRYDRLVSLSPHEVRLRPAPHARTPVLSYSVTVTPEQHFVNWQQDPYGNYVARYVFPERTRELSFTVDLVADMTVINPFDFFVEQYAQQVPWEYPPQLKDELAAYLKPEPAGPRLTDWLASRGKGLLARSMPTSNFLVEINQRLAGDIRYLVRMEPGVQTPEQTLQLASGSCRDSAWLLVQILRHLGLRGPLRLRLSDPAHGRREVARRAERDRERFHRPARLGRGLRARRRLDRARSNVGPVRRRGPHPARLHGPVRRAAPVTGLADRREVDVRPRHEGRRACSKIRA